MYFTELTELEVPNMSGEIRKCGEFAVLVSINGANTSAKNILNTC